jgi:hypothetical protein
MKRSMRVAAHLILTPILLCVGWSFLGIFLVETSGQPSDGTGAMVVGVSALLMLPLGAAYGWRHRHRSMRVAAHLILTPIALYFGWWFLGGFLLGTSGQPSDETRAMVLSLGSLAMIPLGVAYGWRNRHR